jgi:hypothetical protein
MSTNRNRAKLNKAQDGREYRLKLINELYPLYWDEGLNFKKGHSSTKYRSYKTWKYNRKTQYKPLK